MTCFEREVQSVIKIRPSRICAEAFQQDAKGLAEFSFAAVLNCFYVLV